MGILFALIITTIILVAAAFVFAPRAEIVTEITIDATPAEIWSLLGDPKSYRDWNPFIVSMEGELVEGATLTNTLQPQTGNAMKFRPTVLKVEPGHQLRWLGRLGVPRLFDGEHYFILDEKDGHTRLTHGERFHGVLLWVMDVRPFRMDFERMNAALKDAVEARVAARTILPHNG